MTQCPDSHDPIIEDSFEDYYLTQEKIGPDYADPKETQWADVQKWNWEDMFEAYEWVHADEANRRLVHVETTKSVKWDMGGGLCYRDDHFPKHLR